MKTPATFVLILLAAVSCYPQQPSVRDLTVEQFKHAMDSLDNEIIVDLRTPDETRGGKIPGAVEIDYRGPRFKSSIAALDRNKPYLLYCAGGGRSGEAAKLMHDLGFKKIYNLEDGFQGWAKKKMPVDKAPRR